MRPGEFYNNIKNNEEYSYTNIQHVLKKQFWFVFITPAISLFGNFMHQVYKNHACY